MPESLSLTSCHTAAGYTFCAIATLAMLDRSLPTSKSGRSGKSALRTGLRDPVACVRWLVSRPFAYIEASSDDSDSDSQGPHNQPQEDDADSYEPCFPDALPNPPPRTPPHFVAFNGRCNKAADTCYAWWVSGALALLLGSGPPSGYEAIVDRAAAAAARDFLLARTQHVLVGGFGKHVGSRPDIYHSYLGLAALAVLPGGIGCRGRPGSDGSGGLGLKELDPGLCVSVDTRRKIEAARAGLRVPSGSGAPRAEESLSTRLLALARGLETAGGKPAPVAS